MKVMVSQDLIIEDKKDEKFTIERGRILDAIRYEYLPQDYLKTLTDYQRNYIKSGEFFAVYLVGTWFTFDRNRFEIPRWLNGPLG